MVLLRLVFFGAALLFSLGEMGLLTHALNQYVAFLLVIGFVVVSLPRSFGRIRMSNLAAAVLLIAAAAWLARGSEVRKILAFAALAAGLSVLRDDDDRVRQEVEAYVPAAVAFLAFYLIVRHVPHVWWFVNTLALEFSRAVGRMIGQAYAMGATAGGFYVMVFMATWGLARAVRQGRQWRRYVAFLALLVVTAGVVEMLLTPLAIAVQLWVGRLAFVLFNAQTLYLLASLLPAAWYCRKSPDAPARAGKVRARQVGAVLAAGIALGIALGLVPGQRAGGGRVVLLDKGYLDWNVAEFGHYGGRSGGMFGRLPPFLEAQGYEVLRLPGPITGESLAGARALVIINLMDRLEPEEKRAIWDWVHSGGSLLVLGDHTGVMGIREPFNDLLQPVGIEFRFDSATYWGQTWRDAMWTLPHPITGGVTVAEDIQIWIGASLALDPPARPVITAKYGYSDIGDMQNADRSFLGDRRHNPGEQVGDLCLVAEARYGSGRVLVFGDTSPLQGGALVTSWAFVQRVFEWLTNPPSPSRTAVRVAAALAGVVMLLVALKALERFAISWLILGIGLAVAVEATGRLGSLPEAPRIAGPKAVIDLAHGERFDEMTWYDDCLGGLELNLVRNGYTPLLMREFRPSLVRDSDVLIVIAPARRFSRAEVGVLKDLVESGGIVILTTGYEEKDGSEALLRLFGAQLLNVPLAQFETEAFGEKVHFAEAWPLKLLAPGAVTVGRYPGFPDPVAVFVPAGGGGALIVGDSQFLLNANLEGRDEWHLGNIMFLKRFFERARGGGLAG
jgi:hypothetical protein